MLLHAIILAAGRSERMGCPKYALADVSGKSLLESMTEALIRFGCDNIAVVMDKDGSLWYQRHMPARADQLRLVVNPKPILGRYTSLQLGLAALPATEAVFVQNVDNPIVDHGVMQALQKALPECGYARPVSGDRGGHPILISARMAGLLPALLEKTRDVKQSLQHFPRKDVNVKNAGVLININTPEDYKIYLKQLNG